jgi:type II secretory pathway component PulJ
MRAFFAMTSGACTLLALGALTASCASMHGAPPTRQQCLAELTSDADVEGAIDRAHTESLAAAHRSIERIKSEFAGQLAGMNAQQREKFDAATDRFAIASRATADAAQATALWAQGLAADLSDEDLRKIVEFSRTPAGRQVMAGSLTAAMQLQTYLEQQSSATLDKATRQYLAEIKAITGGSVAH